MYNSIEEAEEAKIDLSHRLMAIDSQLAARKASSLELVGQEYKDYVTWRAKAIGAKATLVIRLKRTKLYIQQARERRGLARVKSRGGADGLLSELYKLTRVLVSAGADIDPDEQMLMDDVRMYLENLNDTQEEA